MIRQSASGTALQHIMVVGFFCRTVGTRGEGGFNLQNDSVCLQLAVGLVHMYLGCVPWKLFQMC